MKARWTAGFLTMTLLGCSGSIGDTEATGARTSGSGGGSGSGSSSTASGTGGGVVGVTTGGSSTSSGTGGTSGSGSGPFCDVENVLRTRCQTCHTVPLPAGVPMPLVTYADLVAPAVTDPSRRVIDQCVARMQNAARPMPPAPAAPASASEIAAFQAWIAAGTPSTCSTGSGAGGAGGGSTAAPDAGVVTPIVCTSNQYWTKGDGPLMRPGGACIACHAMSSEAPGFGAAGTVYPTVREPNDCNGINGTTTGTTVVIVDANNRTYTLPVNAAGNFSAGAGTIALPFHAKVVRAGMERVMVAAQMSGDCNSCHTQDGLNGAPGRIVAP